MQCVEELGKFLPMEQWLNARDCGLGEEGAEKFLAFLRLAERHFGLETTGEEDVVVPDAFEGRADSEDSVSRIRISMNLLVAIPSD